MLFLHLVEKLLPRLNNTKIKVQPIFTKEERSRKLVSLQTLMQVAGDVGLSFISQDSYFHFHKKILNPLSYDLWNYTKDKVTPREERCSRLYNDYYIYEVPFISPFITSTDGN